MTTTETPATTDSVRTALAAAIRAPSPHNTQPWRFEVDEDRIDVFLDSDRVPLVGARLANNAFRDAVVGRIQAKVSEDTVLKLSGIADLGGTPSHYIQFKAAHRITDALHVEAGLDFLTGRPETFWGRWGDNDRFFAVVRYFF